MSSMLVALLVPICLATLVFTIVLAKAAIAGRAWPSLETLGLGAVVNFFDTLGIGSFAPTTAWLKFRHLTPDRLIPPTILVGLTAGAVVESIIFLLQLGVKVDPVLLVGCIVACTTGGLIGAPWSTRRGCGSSSSSLPAGCCCVWATCCPVRREISGSSRWPRG